MMNIKTECISVLPKVKDHRGYKDMIFNLSITLECTDLDTGSKISYGFDHIFNTEIKYTEKNPFKSFEDVTKGEIDDLVDLLISDYKVQGYMSIVEWAEERFNDIYSQPVYKPFIFQIPPEPVGIGTSPVL